MCQGSYTPTAVMEQKVDVKQSNVPVTLFLKEFSVRKNYQGRRPGDLEDYHYQVSVSLTGHLEPETGFVVNNGPFIDAVQYDTKTGNRQELAESVLQLTKKQMGKRLIRVVSIVRTIHDGESTRGEWSKGRIPHEKSVDRNKFSVINLPRIVVPAQLVNNAVCGGYDGHFETEVSVVVPKRSAREIQNNLRRSVQVKFAEGTFKASCEELASGVARTAIDVSKGELLRVKARAYNLTGYAEVVWDTGGAMPEFPRLATSREIHQTNEDRRRHDYTPRSC